MYDILYFITLIVFLFVVFSLYLCVVSNDEKTIEEYENKNTKPEEINYKE